MAASKKASTQSENAIPLGDARNPVQVEVVDGECVIRFRVDRDVGPSASGKTTVVATTRGNVTLPGGVTLGLNAYRKGDAGS